MLFPSTRRAFVTLLNTPLIPPSAPPPTFELQPIARPGRPRQYSRTLSNISVRGTGYSVESRRGYASDKGKKELYSDEAGATGAGTDDVAHTDAAFDKNADPQSSAKRVEKETGKDFTKRSPANPAESKPPGKQGEDGADLGTSKENK